MTELTPSISPLASRSVAMPELVTPHGASRVRWGDLTLNALSVASAICILLMIAALLVVLVKAALPSVRENGAKFLATKEWRVNPLPGEIVRGLLVHAD